MLIDPTLRYDDEQACNQTGYSWRLSQHHENLTKVFNLYPNPTASTVKVKYKIEETTKLGIFNQLGGLVIFKELQKDSNEMEIDVSSLNNGVYTCKLMNGNSTDVKQLIILK